MRLSSRSMLIWYPEAGQSHYWARTRLHRVSAPFREAVQWAKPQHSAVCTLSSYPHNLSSRVPTQNKRDLQTPHACRRGPSLCYRTVRTPGPPPPPHKDRTSATISFAKCEMPRPLLPPCSLSWPPPPHDHINRNIYNDTCVLVGGGWL